MHVGTESVSGRANVTHINTKKGTEAVFLRLYFIHLNDMCKTVGEITNFYNCFPLFY